MTKKPGTKVLGFFISDFLLSSNFISFKDLFSNSTNSLGLEAATVFTLGIRLDVSRSWNRKIF
ncbi:hypothetical protein [Robiginitalea sp.]|uniref:hypothetical protein n=1 Tax=Robiginitalea sp. TaxID=1902411 RepID=UPI003C5C967A